jgi:hypothetical protein
MEIAKICGGNEDLGDLEHDDLEKKEDDFDQGDKPGELTSKPLGGPGRDV